jgi:hypothetical protein
MGTALPSNIDLKIQGGNLTRLPLASFEKLRPHGTDKVFEEYSLTPITLNPLLVFLNHLQIS